MAAEVDLDRRARAVEAVARGMGPTEAARACGYTKRYMVMLADEEWFREAVTKRAQEIRDGAPEDPDERLGLVVIRQIAQNAEPKEALQAAKLLVEIARERRKAVATIERKPEVVSIRKASDEEVAKWMSEQA